MTGQVAPAAKPSPRLAKARALFGKAEAATPAPAPANDDAPIIAAAAGLSFVARYEGEARRLAALLAEARTSDELMGLRGAAEAMRANAKISRNRALELDAVEIRAMAERRLGAQIAEAKRGGLIAVGQPKKNAADDAGFSRIRLSEIGVDEHLSRRAQSYAALSDEEWEAARQRWRDEVAASGAKVVTGLLRERRKAETRAAHAGRAAEGCSVADLEALIASGRTFGAITADPPWRFEAWSERGEDRAPQQHYGCDDLKSIAALPVAKLAARDSVLFVWAIMPMLREALDLVDAWGFDFKTCAFTWMKQNKSGDGLFIGNGYWTRANAEICLLATRGAPLRLDAGVPQALLAPVGEHSRKPEEIAARIERLVGGAYLELYARRPRPGWTTWGNEIAPAAMDAAAAEGESA